MNQRGFKNILFIVVLFLVFAGVVGYLIFAKKSPEITQTLPLSTQTTNQSVISNIFTYKSKPGDKVGDMVLSKINHPTNESEPTSPDYVYAEFVGTISVIGRLSTPTGKPEDAGMGPDYSLNNLTQNSLKKLPYLQSDTRTVWFGIKNQDIMKNFSVKNDDLVEMTINKYEYVFFPAGVWNQADVVTVKKIEEKKININEDKEVNYLEKVEESVLPVSQEEMGFIIPETVWGLFQIVLETNTLGEQVYFGTFSNNSKVTYHAVVPGTVIARGAYPGDVLGYKKENNKYFLLQDGIKEVEVTQELFVEEFFVANDQVLILKGIDFSGPSFFPYESEQIVAYLNTPSGKLPGGVFIAEPGVYLESLKEILSQISFIK